MTEERIKNLEQLERGLGRIKFRPSCIDMGWKWRIEDVYGLTGADAEGKPDFTQIGWHISASFKRPDTDTGKTGIGYGRREFVEFGASISALVKTAWVCINMTINHEQLEGFCFDGERVFDPHKSVYELATPRKKME